LSNVLEQHTTTILRTEEKAKKEEAEGSGNLSCMLCLFLLVLAWLLFDPDDGGVMPI
jgi:hypothetical protein